MNKPSNSSSQNFDISWIHKQAKCWVYFPNKQEGDIYLRGTVQKINALNFNKANSVVKGVLQTGIQFQTKAHLLEKCRESKSIERDLIQMDIINGAQVLNQLKKRFQQKKIHTYLWNSLIIVNPFQLVVKNYGQSVLQYYYENIFLRDDTNLIKFQPHIYAFMFHILKHIKQSPLSQVLSISGQSGSGKTQTNKQCLKAISYGCQKQKLKSQKHLSDNNLQIKILQCDPILQAFGNAKTVKNDNSSRFGKLISIKIDQQTITIQYSSIKNYFLQKSRIISQANGQRNFHIFYLFLKFMPDHQKANLKLKNRHGGLLKFQDFHYISQKHSYGTNILISQKQMWNQLTQAFKKLQFKKQTIHEIWSVIAAVLLLGNLTFDGALQNEHDPCQISNPQVVTNIAHLLRIKRQELEAGLVFNKKIIAGELMYIPLTQKQCQQGRDSMAKAIYQGLFTWIVEELNKKVNIDHNPQMVQQCKQIKLLDIYGFEVFQKNSFEQLCVNYTNQKIHQIYLEQVFIHEKKILKNQGLQANIPSLNFTDNYKIIELLDTSAKSIYNLLDESCTLNVKDNDFLSNIRKNHQHHQNFPISNSTNIRNSFIIKHTPGQIEYMVQGFRDKNKDLLRQDIIHKLSQSQSSVVREIFQIKLQSMKSQSTKKYLGIKIRKQVRQLINQMSTNTNLHFVRCIKPNEIKKGFTFVDRVCYNQIKYLGILDTIQMRKQSYHVRIVYSQFYKKFGILQAEGLDNLIRMQNSHVTNNQCRQMSMTLMTNNLFTNHKLEYLFGKEKIFMKMSTKNFLDILLKNKTAKIQYACTVIKSFYRMYTKRQLKKTYKQNVPKIQYAVRNFLTIVKLLKKKNAVLTIERYWIKYCTQFFMRKRRNYVITLQKYIKRAICSQKQQQKSQNMLKIKKFIQSAIQTHKQQKLYKSYSQVKQVIKKDVFNKVWQKVEQHYKSKVKSYLKTFSTRKMHRQRLYTSQKSAKIRQSIRYYHDMQIYIKGFLAHRLVTDHLQNIRKIQKYIKMRKIRTIYSSLKQNVIKIQKAWRNYYQFKQRSIMNTKKYFQNQLKQQKQYTYKILFRQIQGDNKNKSVLHNLAEDSVQKVLYQQQKIKRDKIGLFYYLLDFQQLCSLAYIYPQNSWVENYSTLYRESIQKGNPIQYVDISSTHTVCTTINKIYQWGQIHQQKGIRTQIPYQNIPTPNGRINKVKACDGFTIIQTQEPQELLIMGNQRQYEQSSIKQWSTVRESFVLLNGVILTLKQSSLTKVHIPQKVTFLSCGMAHVLCKTSLKKIYSWGQSAMGQLGHGTFKRSLVPKCIQFFSKNKIMISQIGATAHGSVVLDINCKIWWFGSNGTIKNEPLPRQAFLPLKSEFIDNSKKYSVVRIIPKWSKSISIIGLTIAIYDGAFKATQTGVRKKCLQNLMQKWSQDVQTINPPYIASLSGFFSQKHMYFKKPANTKKTQSQNMLTYQQIKNKLVNQMIMIQHAQKKLLNTIKGEYSSRSYY